MWRIYLQFIAAVLPGLCLSAYAWSESLELNEDDSIIVELKYKRMILSDAMLIYHNTDSTMVSLDEFIEALDYPITVDSDAGQATGWFVSEENSFTLDIHNKQIHLRGKKQTLPEGFLYALDDFGLYLDLKDLEKWFDIKLTLYMSRLQILIESEFAQPVEAKAIREIKRKKSEAEAAKKRVYPKEENKYLIASPPAIDMQLSTLHDEEATLFGYSFKTAGDLLYHETRLSHNRVNQFSDTVTHLAFFRDAPHPETDIAHGITHYSFGDIYIQGDNLISAGGSGVGFHLERNISQSLNDAFSNRDFEGDAPPGWEAEIYHNSLLIGFMVVDESGRYLFRDIALQYGENIFEIVLYGPQGQKRVIKDKLSIGGDLLTPGQWQFSFSHLKEDDQLIGARPVQGNPPEPTDYVTLSSYYGINSRNSVGLGFSRVAPSTQIGLRDFPQASWIASFSTFSSRLEYAYDLENSGDAINLDIKGRALGQDYNIEVQKYRDFISAKSNLGNTLQRSEIKIFGNAKVFKRRMPYSLGYNLAELSNGVDYFRMENVLAYSLGRSRLSNQITYSGSNQSQDQYANGVFSINRRGSIQLRAGLNYDITTLKKPTSLSLTGDFSAKGWHFQIQGNTSFLEEKPYSVELSISRLFKDTSISFGAKTDSEGNMVAGLNLEFGLYTQAKRPWVGLAQYGVQGSGTAKARVFMDNDFTGTFTPGDNVMEGIQFKGRSTWAKLKTDENGEITLRGIDASRGTLVHVDTNTLGDPYLRPRTPAFRVYSHSGALQSLDIPISETTEIEGHLFLVDGEKKKGIGGVPVGLYQNGTLMKRVATEFDGYYFINEVTPGKYRVDLIDSGNIQSRYSWEKPGEFSTDMEMGITVVPNIELTRLPEE